MKRIILIAILAVAFALGIFAATSIAKGPPPGNPGSPGDNCSHGNSNKPCKDDPQPDKGKDCEDHGVARGNEDHCDQGPGSPPTPTTPTSPPETTPSTPEEPTITLAPESPTSLPGQEEPGASAEEEPSTEVVNVKPGKKPGTVIIVTSDGEESVGVQGSG